MTTTAPAATRRTGRVLLAVGLLLPFAGLAAYAAQMSLHRLSSPLYVPLLATAGVALVALALWQSFSVWRVLALVFVVALCGLEWLGAAALRLPAYTGPVAAGRAFPAFATLRADGTPFTQRDLAGGRDTVMVFFRGRW